ATKADPAGRDLDKLDAPARDSTVGSACPGAASLALPALAASSGEPPCPAAAEPPAGRQADPRDSVLPEGATALRHSSLLAEEPPEFLGLEDARSVERVPARDVALLELQPKEGSSASLQDPEAKAAGVRKGFDQAAELSERASPESGCLGEPPEEQL